MEKLIEEYYQNSGRILSMALQVESKLDLFISHYFVTPLSIKTIFFEEVYLSCLDFENKVKIFQELCKKERFSKNEINSTINNIREIQKIRNRIAHWELKNSLETGIYLTDRKSSSEILKLDKELVDGLNKKRIRAIQGILKFYEKYRREGSFEKKSDIVISKRNWFEIYEKVKDFSEDNLHIPKISSKNKFERDLGKWCGYQRQARKEKRLSKEKITLLDAIPNWYWKGGDRWEIDYRKVLNFVTVNGHFPRKKDFRCFHQLISEEEERLERWVRRMKETYRGRKGYPKSTKQQIIKLEKIPGWTWYKNSIRSWNQCFFDLQKYLEKNKSYPKSTALTNEEENTYNTYIWVLHQKKRYLEGKLTSEQISKLESLPGWDWKRKSHSRF